MFGWCGKRSTNWNLPTYMVREFYGSYNTWGWMVLLRKLSRRNFRGQVSKQHMTMNYPRKKKLEEETQRICQFNTAICSKTKKVEKVMFIIIMYTLHQRSKHFVSASVVLKMKLILYALDKIQMGNRVN